MHLPCFPAAGQHPRCPPDHGTRAGCPLPAFCHPLFRQAAIDPHWEKVYGLEVEAVDVGEAFVRLLRERPAHGFGKVMKPLCRLQNPHDAQGAGTHEKMGSVIPYLR